MVGTNNFRHSNLASHSQSEGHKIAVEHAKNRNAPPGQSTAEVTLQKMNSAVFTKLCYLFRNAHAICMNNRPLKDFVWMASLDVKKELMSEKRTATTRRADNLFLR